MTVAAVGNGVVQEERRRLHRSRAVATGLLVVAGAVFLLTLAIPQPGTGLLLLRAVAEAAMVGGLADWFAVTALFRHPLGLPIPHTAILPGNKDRIGEGLARFLDRHFLTPELLLPEVRTLRLADRLAEWLAQRRNAQLLADEITKALPLVLHAIDDRQLTAFLGRALGPQLRAAQFGPLLGHLIRVLTSSGYHQPVLDAALDHARDFLSRNEERMLEAVASKRRRWMPQAINREIARTMLRAAAELIEDLRKPDGATRQTLLAKIDQLADELANGALQPSPGFVLRRADLRFWIAASWQRLHPILLADFEDPSSRTGRVLAAMIGSVGEALKTDAAMRERLDTAFEALVVQALPWRAEMVRFVVEVVHRWQPREFSNRIEAAVGADLQYIRMNGTLVGGMVGGGLFILSLLVG